MIYQFPSHLVPFVIVIDLALLGLLYLSIKYRKKSSQRTAYVLAILGFLGFSAFKTLFTTPAPVASTPADLRIETSKPFNTIYYLTWNEGNPEVIWKDILIGEQTDRYFELESEVRNGLLIATKVNDNIGYQTIQLDWRVPTMVNLEQEDFKVDRENKINDAIKRYRWTEFGNYLSYLLTVAFVGTFIWRMAKYGF